MRDVIVVEDVIADIASDGPASPMRFIERFTMKHNIDPVKVQNAMWTAVNGGLLDIDADGRLVVAASD